MKIKYKLPYGTQDYLPGDCYAKNGVENVILECFRAHGYERVETPHFEYYDVFTGGVGEVAANKLFKFTDTDGNILVLRPDMTMPIARVVSTKLVGEENLKLCYRGNSFSMPEQSNRSREFTQLGVELIEGASPETDGEVIALAVEALGKAGLEEFQIDIGNVAYFKGLLDSLRLDDDDEATLVDLIDKKDMLGVEIFAKRAGISESDLDPLLKLPSLFGGVEVLDAAVALANNDESRAAIEHLKRVYDIITECGLGEYISFDLSLVNGVSYYTGIVFKGITRYFGAPILSGGRYDTLCASFDSGSRPAIGFAIGVKYLMSALDKAGVLPVKPCADFAVGYEDGAYPRAYRVTQELIKAGYTVDNSFRKDAAELREYARARGIASTVYVTRGGGSVSALPSGKGGYKFDAEGKWVKYE